jgi:hypothetical protein
MSLSEVQKSAVLSAARALIGTPYSDLDCSHFVNRAYSIAGLYFPYQATATFNNLVGSFFDVVVAKSSADYEAADVLMFTGHVGLWDPDGCQILQKSKAPDAVCADFKNQVPFLSSRSGGNLGPEFGKLNWFGGGVKQVYRWKTPATP